MGATGGSRTLSDSAFGVITIETKVRLTREERKVLPPHLRGVVYNWALEVEKHSWKRVFLSSLAGNAVGLAAGLAVARECVKLEELATDVFASSCDNLATAGSWTAAVSLPLLGAALGARYAGATPISRGRFLPAVISGGAAVLPGYAMMTSSGQTSDSSTMRVGQLFLLVGIPAAVTVADRLFRAYRSR